jgi:hypothetical protein
MKKELVVIFSYQQIDLFIIKGPKIKIEDIKLALMQSVIYTETDKNQWSDVIENDEWNKYKDGDLSSVEEATILMGSCGPLEFRTEWMFVF